MRCVLLSQKKPFSVETLQSLPFETVHIIAGENFSQLKRAFYDVPFVTVEKNPFWKSTKDGFELALAFDLSKEDDFVWSVDVGSVTSILPFYDPEVNAIALKNGNPVGGIVLKQYNDTGRRAIKKALYRNCKATIEELIENILLYLLPIRKVIL